jgi:hypothetical protein
LEEKCPTFEGDLDKEKISTDETPIDSGSEDGSGETNSKTV